MLISVCTQVVCPPFLAEGRPQGRVDWRQSTCLPFIATASNLDHCHGWGVHTATWDLPSRTDRGATGSGSFTFPWFPPPPLPHPSTPSPITHTSLSSTLYIVLVEEGDNPTVPREGQTLRHVSQNKRTKANSGETRSALCAVDNAHPWTMCAVDNTHPKS